MKVTVKLDADAVRRATEQVVALTSVEVVSDTAEAEVVITNDKRLMLSCLKQGKYVIQLAGASDELAVGLSESYPDLFRGFRVNEVAPLMGYLVELQKKETEDGTAENPGR